MKKIWILAVLLFPLYLHGEYNPLERISVTNSGNAADGASSVSAITSDATGRYVVFVSTAENFVNSDDNGLADIYLRDTLNDTVSLVTRATDGGAASGPSSNPSISADGRFIAFQSSADDLVPVDDNNFIDIFLYDRVLDTISIVSRPVLNEADGPSGNPEVSDDGLFVVFDSNATNFGPVDSNNLTDIFLYDVALDTISLVTLDSLSGPTNGNSFNPTINGDGRFIAFESDAEDIDGSDNGLTDIFLYDRISGTTTLVSKDGAGEATNGNSSDATISFDGTVIAYQSNATDIATPDTDADTDIYAYNTVTAVTDLISQASTGLKANEISTSPSISADGRYVAFQSTANNLAPQGDNNDVSDIFVRDRLTSSTVLASITPLGLQANGASSAPSINGTAQFLAFTSDATNLVTDSNDLSDIFLLDQQCILAPPGVVPADQDGDATDDCADECPFDGGKIAEGACGCGTADSDSDGDASADCIDQCDNDPAKSEVGDCGCGVADTDANANGQSDCLDVTVGTVPPAPKVKVTKRETLHGRRVNQILVRVIAPLGFVVDKYRFYVRRKGEIIAQKTKGIRSARFSISQRGLSSGRYAASYDLAVPGTASFTQESPRTKFKIE